MPPPVVTCGCDGICGLVVPWRCPAPTRHPVAASAAGRESPCWPGRTNDSSESQSSLPSSAYIRIPTTSWLAANCHSCTEYSSAALRDIPCRMIARPYESHASSTCIKAPAVVRHTTKTTQTHTSPQQTLNQTGPVFGSNSDKYALRHIANTARRAMHVRHEDTWPQ